MMSAEFDFADEKENTNEIPVDEQSTGDNEDSDGDGIQGPPPPTEFKRLLEVWAKDFERMEAAIYQQQAAADNISALETLRLHDAMDAATSTAEASTVAIQQFVDQSGNPELPAIFQEIQMEATLLMGARNDATRKAQKAKEAAEL